MHLLPSSLDFVQIQDRLINIGQIAMIRPFEVLKRTLGSRVDQYDVVLIDCPPNLGIVASMFRANVPRQVSTLVQLQAKADQGHLPRLFKTKIPLASKMSDASEFESNVDTIKQKYGVVGVLE